MSKEETVIDEIDVSRSPSEHDHNKEDNSKKVSYKEADELLKFMEEHEPNYVELTEDEEKKVLRKNFTMVLFLVSLVTLILFMDKSTIGYTTILGIYKDTSLTKGGFNNLNSIFYVGYLVAQWPCHILMQKLPIGKYLAGSIFMWAIIIGGTAACKNYSQLMACRFLLGASEAVVTPACEMTLGMFLDTKQREIAQPIFWASASAAPFISSFIAFGLLKAEHLMSTYPWRVFMAVNSGLSLFLSIAVFILYPDNPSNAKFLTNNEKVFIIKRIQESTKSSIEQKTVKKHQIIETLKDPISWLFAFQSFTLMLSNSLTYQQNQLYVDIGVDNLGSSLVSAAGSVWNVLLYIIFAFVIKKFPNQNAYIGCVCLILPIASSIAMCTIPWEKKYALLANMILAGSSKGITYIVALGWTTSSAGGYTKKLYRNVMFMIAYAIANIISPNLWNPKNSPRYYTSWIVQIIVAFFLNGVILLTIRYILKKRNEERLHATDFEDDYYVENDEGISEKVDIAMLDLTDLENKRFIYPL
ncbi:putative membrane protein [Wickerhamomyces ciferrii]|uniref:Membrane protein n=1 Tax=Wickerhamomyces ciferrii (strain ATCC 14091 / BCRC 22168 / CBS 111 / JCM 3599 / NBRC 0793 / NRRL Y-1031 F-60-10) TaxID=1206466 RepID=K0KCP0_WICCF|nr:uncharacterized protein BN7_2390 [Wickerhamomyces ciferrii]CCH42845.1 putative membrane protein [Wickerhamomyces ciferrii]